MSFFTLACALLYEKLKKSRSYHITFSLKKTCIVPLVHVSFREVRIKEDTTSKLKEFQDDLIAVLRIQTLFFYYIT